MEIRIEAGAAGAAVARLAGRLDAQVAAEVRKGLEDAIAEGCVRLDIDLADVPFADSSGLGTLVAVLKAARRAGGDVRLVAPGEQVRKLLRLTTLERVFTIAEA